MQEYDVSDEEAHRTVQEFVKELRQKGFACKIEGFCILVPFIPILEEK